jgi:uncharacterized repeat protein (TIGR03803 family)
MPTQSKSRNHSATSSVTPADMASRIIPAIMKKTAILILMMIAFTGFGVAADEAVLYNFSLSEGFSPEDGVVFRAGRLFGTTTQGGAFGYGVVFELARSNSGWMETVLYSFAGGADGAYPVAGVTFDREGNLYGTTSSDASGHGVIYRLTPSPTGWMETVLYTFAGGNDGEVPIARVTIDKAGNLFGTTLFGGTAGCGVVFELMPQQGGWAESVLHSFAGCNGNAHPQAGVVLRGRSLYGTTYEGGASGRGTVFKLTPSEAGWTETVLYSFTGGTDGAFPSGVIFRKDRLYGTTNGGGNQNDALGNGVVFELSPSKQSWTEKVIHTFTGTPDGAVPFGSVAFDRVGSLYSTTWSGGVGGHGTAFKLTPSSSGWTETVLHSFNGASDGDLLLAGVILDHEGNLYGTTAGGGLNGGGVVFEIISDDEGPDD